MLVKSIICIFILQLSCGYRSPEERERERDKSYFFEQCSSVHVFSIREIGSDVVSSPPAA